MSGLTSAGGLKPEKHRKPVSTADRQSGGEAAAFPPGERSQYITVRASQRPASLAQSNNVRLGTLTFFRADQSPRLPWCSAPNSHASLAGLNPIFSKMLYKPFWTLCVRWEMPRACREVCRRECFDFVLTPTLLHSKEIH